MSTQIVILAAGKGTRMGEMEIPKVLAPLHEKPVLTYLLNEISNLVDLEPTVLVVGYKHDQVRATAGPSYRYAFQEELKGTAHALLCAKPEITGDDIIVLYGDMPLIKAASLEKLMDLHRANQAKVSIFTTIAPNFEGRNESMNHYGRIIRNAAGDIVKITEFKDATPNEQALREVNPGIYMFNTSWLWQHMDAITSDNSQHEYYLTDIIEVAIRTGEKIYSLEIGPDEVFGINTKEHLEHAHDLLS
jgi:bifunctional N-acetylglucosamine-1-phosphate-uridyltransferase/glucosamine-1-phosphate-acetyltransferase GlmU-like protein